MTLVVTSQANRAFAKTLADDAVFISPASKRAVHGMSRVIIVGIHPAVERRYTGICPVQVVYPQPKKSEIVNE